MDDQQKKQVIIAGVLGAVLVGVLVYQFLLAGEPPPGSAEIAGDKGNAADTAKKPPSSTGPAETGASVNLLEATEIDIEELTQSVEVQPMEYRAVKIARNPLTPLVGIIGGPGETEIVEPPGDAGATPSVSRRIREVTGVIWDEVNPVAIIDNMVVHEGYVFADGVVVQSIEPTRVLLKIGESIRPLEMKEF